MIQAVVFDAYGTLLDVHGAMQRHADRLPPDWERISAEWRGKQLEYSWVRSLTGPAHHRDFWQITLDSLDVVATRHRITDPAVKAQLLDAYRTLPAYADAKPCLAALRDRGLKTAILSNGEPGMLEDAVQAAGLGPLLDQVISIEEVGIFKPDPRVYALCADRMELPAESMGFVSSNAWDAQAAAANGFHVFWCNRAGNPHEYGLRDSATTLASLAALDDAIG